MRSAKIVCFIVLGVCLVALAGCNGSDAIRPATEKPTSVKPSDPAQTEAAQETKPADPAQGASSQDKQPDEPEGQDDGQPSSPPPNTTDPVAVAIEWISETYDQPKSKLSGKIVATAQSGEESWVCVSVSQPGYETESVYLSQKVKGGEWIRRSYGTGTTYEDLISRYGLSPEAAKKLTRGR